MKKSIYNSDDEQFLLARLKEDWRAAERALKHHEVARRVKEGGLFLGKTILACALLGGILVVATAAPNAFGVVGNALLRRRYFGKREFEEQVRVLKKRGYVHVEKTDHGYRVTPTKEGRKRVLDETDRHLTIRKPTRWDGTWWLVMFDIPRKHNAERNALRARFKAMGMELLQASVFASKYPCADEVWFTARLFSVEHYVAVAHVDSIEGFGKRLDEIL